MISFAICWYKRCNSEQPVRQDIKYCDHCTVPRHYHSLRQPQVGYLRALKIICDYYQPICIEIFMHCMYVLWCLPQLQTLNSVQSKLEAMSVAQFRNKIVVSKTYSVPSMGFKRCCVMLQIVTKSRRSIIMCIYILLLIILKIFIQQICDVIV